jgi:hypothetical protein
LFVQQHLLQGRSPFLPPHLILVPFPPSSTQGLRFQRK